MAELGVPKSTYYRWRARKRHGSLEVRSSSIGVWNRLTPEEESVLLQVAVEYTDLSSGQLAAWITDNKGFSVSESTVYRILRREGLVKSPEMKMAAGKEFHTNPDMSGLTRCGPPMPPTSGSWAGVFITWSP